jgi:dUTP pyrophosphatase
MLQVNIKSIGGVIPAYAHDGDAGMDLRAYLPNGGTYINPGSRALIPTGLIMEIPNGYELQVRPRSGLAIKQGITVLNTPGTVDSPYRGEICVILINLGEDNFSIKHGDRIAQGVFNKIEQAVFTVVEELTDTDRGAGGFGHTGTN